MGLCYKVCGGTGRREGRWRWKSEVDGARGGRRVGGGVVVEEEGVVCGGSGGGPLVAGSRGCGVGKEKGRVRVARGGAVKMGGGRRGRFRMVRGVGWVPTVGRWAWGKLGGWAG